MKKLNRAMEQFWLIVTIVATGMAIWMLFNLGWEKGAWYLLFPGLAGLMWMFRRTMRKRMDQNQGL